MFKRWFFVGGMIALFFVMIVGFAGCSVLENIQGSDLQGAMGDGNGPGSGEWKMRRPQNLRQCNAAHQTLTNLAADVTVIGVKIDEEYARCYIEGWKLRPGVDREGCEKPMAKGYEGFNKGWRDFVLNAEVYGESCASSTDGEIIVEARTLSTIPSVPGLPPLGADDPPTTEEPGDETGEDEIPWGGYCCLTCIQSIPMNYTIYNGPIELNNS